MFSSLTFHTTAPGTESSDIRFICAVTVYLPGLQISVVIKNSTVKSGDEESRCFRGVSGRLVGICGFQELLDYYYKGPGSGGTPLLWLWDKSMAGFRMATYSLDEYIQLLNPVENDVTMTCFTKI